MDGVTTALELEAGVLLVRSTSWDLVNAAAEPCSRSTTASPRRGRWPGWKCSTGSGWTASCGRSSPTSRALEWQHAATGPEVRRVLARLEADMSPAVVPARRRDSGKLPSPRPRPGGHSAVAVLATRTREYPATTHSRDLIPSSPLTPSSTGPRRSSAPQAKPAPLALLPRQQHHAAAGRPGARPG